MTTQHPILHFRLKIIAKPKIKAQPQDIPNQSHIRIYFKYSFNMIISTTTLLI